LPIFDPKKCYNPYSQDLSLPDYFLFPKLKIKLKGLHFADVAEIQEATADELKKVQKLLFRKCMTVQKPVYMSSGAYCE